MSNRALWASPLRQPRGELENIGSTRQWSGASHTIAVVIPVTGRICGRDARCGSTRVATRPAAHHAAADFGPRRSIVDRVGDLTRRRAVFDRLLSPVDNATIWVSRSGAVFRSPVDVG